MLVSIPQLAERLGISEFTVRALFKQWCALQGVSPKKYLILEPRKRYDIPERAVLWIRERARVSKIRSGRGSTRLYKELLGVTTIKDIATNYDVNEDFIRREFRWWCYDRGKSPREYYIPGIGYALPEEFIKYVTPVVKRHLSKKRVVKFDEVMGNADVY